MKLSKVLTAARVSAKRFAELSQRALSEVKTYSVLRKRYIDNVRKYAARTGRTLSDFKWRPPTLRGLLDISKSKNAKAGEVLDYYRESLDLKFFYGISAGLRQEDEQYKANALSAIAEVEGFEDDEDLKGLFEDIKSTDARRFASENPDFFDLIYAEGEEHGIIRKGVEELLGRLRL